MVFIKDDDSWTVYMHDFPNGKKYIGITSKNTDIRWGVSGRGYNNQKLMHSAISKYEWENIKHVIIMRDLTKIEACELEQDLIFEYKSNNIEFGYNLTIGGESGSSNKPRKIIPRDICRKYDKDCSEIIKKLCFDYSVKSKEFYKSLKSTFSIKGSICEIKRYFDYTLFNNASSDIINSDDQKRIICEMINNTLLHKEEIYERDN